MQEVFKGLDKGLEEWQLKMKANREIIRIKRPGDKETTRPGFHCSTGASFVAGGICGALIGIGATGIAMSYQAGKLIDEVSVASRAEGYEAGRIAGYHEAEAQAVDASRTNEVYVVQTDGMVKRLVRNPERPEESRGSSVLFANGELEGLEKTFITIFKAAETEASN
jgi:hypothetical protein